jgi:hypothetical protein
MVACGKCLLMDGCSGEIVVYVECWLVEDVCLWKIFTLEMAAHMN